MAARYFGGSSGVNMLGISGTTMLRRGFSSCSAISSSLETSGIVTIALTQGAKRNPLSMQTMAHLTAALHEASNSKDCRAILLHAEGPAFSAGHDLKELRLLAAIEDEAIRHDSLSAVFDQCSQLMKAIRETPVPVIAAVQGPAHAAGCQLVASVDIAVADGVHATFATPGVKIGLFCHTPAVAVVRALGAGAGARAAAKMLYTGEPIGAEEALRIGLIHEIAPEGESLAVATRLAAQVASYSSPVQRDGKKVLRETTAAGDDLDAAYEIASSAMVRGLKGGVSREGIGAFLEKRPPEWTE